MRFMDSFLALWLVQVMYDAKVDRWYWEVRDNETLVAMSIGNFATQEQAQIAAGRFQNVMRY